MAFTVLVTRPAHQSAQLELLLKQAGFKVISFPTIAIEPAGESLSLQALKTRIANYDIALFVSRNAVDHAFAYLDVDALPQSLQLGVIGKGTRQALEKHGVPSQIIPADDYNSEGLLKSAVLQRVSGKRIVIFRGQQGRTLLGDTLQQRGAEVDHIEVYRRVLPNYAPGHFKRLCVSGFPHIAVFTSSEGLTNCFRLLNAEQADKMRHCDWLLISERMRETAHNLRHNAAHVIADKASDDGILIALQHWRNAQV